MGLKYAGLFQFRDPIPNNFYAYKYILVFRGQTYTAMKLTTKTYKRD